MVFLDLHLPQSLLLCIASQAVVHIYSHYPHCPPLIVTQEGQWDNYCAHRQSDKMTNRKRTHGRHKDPLDG